jgi:hypothetical protein
VSALDEIAEIESWDDVPGEWLPSAHARATGPVTRGELDVKECTVDTEGMPPKFAAAFQKLAAQQAGQPAFVPDRLQRRAARWRAITSDPLVLGIVSDGYTPTLKSEVPVRKFENHKGCFESEETVRFIDDAISDLLKSGAVREIVDRRAITALVVSPLNVAPKKGSKKYRLIIDMRMVNDFVVSEKFKYENLATEGRRVFAPGYHTAAADLAAAYHHVPIASMAQYLYGFAWRGRFYVYTVLPFGFVEAPRVFTRMCKPMVAMWRGGQGDTRRDTTAGVALLPYVDDFAWGDPNWLRTLEWSLRIATDMTWLGWLISFGKSDFLPRQRREHLGFLMDTSVRLRGVLTGAFMVPVTRQERIIAKATEIKSSRRVMVRRLAKLAGDVVSASLALGGVARLFTRRLYALIETRDGWNSWVNVSEEVRQECDFWMTAPAHIWEGQPILRCERYRDAVDVVAWTDASDFAYGGFLSEQAGLHRHAARFVRGDLTKFEQSCSSMVRELLGLLYMLRSMPRSGPGSLDDKIVKASLDNQGAVFALGGEVFGFDGIYGGSPKVACQEVAEDILRECIQRRIRLVPLWVPREFNQIADFMSKIRDTSDWQLARRWVHALDSRFGEHEIDRFANNSNVVVRSGRFCSRWWCPGTMGVNALLMSWRGYNNWCNPPFMLVGDVIEHLLFDQSVATVIVPYWPGHCWWPLVCPDGRHWAPYVVDALEIPQEGDTFHPGETSMKTSGMVTRPRFRVFALRVDGRRSRAQRAVSGSGRMVACSLPPGCCPQCGGDRRWLRDRSTFSWVRPGGPSDA